MGFDFPQETHVIHQHVQVQTSSNEGCECLPQGDDSIEITFSVGDGESRRFQLDFEPDLVEQPLHTYAPWGLSRRKLRLCLACRGGSFVKSSDWDSSDTPPKLTFPRQCSLRSRRRSTVEGSEEKKTANKFGSTESAETRV
jgi:hypothetical protein